MSGAGAGAGAAVVVVMVAARVRRRVVRGFILKVCGVGAWGAFCSCLVVVVVVVVYVVQRNTRRRKESEKGVWVVWLIYGLLLSLLSFHFFSLPCAQVLNSRCRVWLESS